MNTRYSEAIVRGLIVDRIKNKLFFIEGFYSAIPNRNPTFAYDILNTLQPLVDANGIQSKGIQLLLDVLPYLSVVELQELEKSIKADFKWNERTWKTKEKNREMEDRNAKLSAELRLSKNSHC